MTRRRPTGDDGTSLLEVLVGMGLMAIFMAMFTGAIVVMTNTQQKVESVSATTSQLSLAFLTLDRTVRYADAISVPATGTAGAWYVELRSPNPTGTAGTELCTQLRVTTPTNATSPAQLQRRSWVVGQTVPTALNPAFTPIASEITNGDATAGASQPFLPVPLKSNVAFQQLTINLVSANGVTSNKTQSSTAVTFTAVNSAIPVPSGAICGENLAATRP